MGFFPPDYKPASGESSGSEIRTQPQVLGVLVSTWVTARPSPSVPAASSTTATWSLDTSTSPWKVVYGGSPSTPRTTRRHRTDLGSQERQGAELEKLEAEGKAKDRPKFFMSFINYFPDRKDFVCVTVTQKKVREQIEAILDMEDYFFMDSGVANFTVTVKRKGEGTETTWTVTPTLKKPTAAFRGEVEGSQGRDLADRPVRRGRPFRR